MPKRNTAPSEADQLNDGMVVLHRSCFVEWQPSPLVALGCSTDGSLSVAVRENGDVELYETSTRMHLQVRLQLVHTSGHLFNFTCIPPVPSRL